jgi:phosphate starvation-inducible protein PhoH and related proteins
MGNKYSRKVKNRKAAESEVDVLSPWKNPAEPEAPYHPSAKLAHLSVKPKSLSQQSYLDSMGCHDVVFGIGPAGTGKTYLAVAKAITWLAKKGNKLVIARPAVEAGERLGFLPGSLQEKVDPYLRPIYDALYDLMDAVKVDHYLENGIIEVAPIAFMRGRTLNNAFIILDEAQNTTEEQMFMFLTRMGENSKMVVTGDITQVDLPKGKKSGLVDAIEALTGVEGLFLQYFDEGDVVRHPMVQKICVAYEAHRHPKVGDDGSN